MIPVTGRYDDPEAVWRQYSSALSRLGVSYVVTYVLDGEQPAMAAALQQLAERGEAFNVIRFSRPLGEVACLRECMRMVDCELVMTLPAYLQSEPDAIPAMIAAAQGADVVVGVRDRRGDQWMNRLRSWSFERLVNLGGSRYRDPGSVLRVIRRSVLDELVLGDDHLPFVPLLAERLGFNVVEVNVPQARSDIHFRKHSPRRFAANVLDVISIGFLLRFTYKPFRFFGTTGALLILAGLIVGSSIVVERWTQGTPLSERPLLLLSVLLVVVGIQIAATGLIAEIAIFTRRPSENVSYRIRRVIERVDADDQIAS